MNTKKTLRDLQREAISMKTAKELTAHEIANRIISSAYDAGFADVIQHGSGATVTLIFNEVGEEIVFDGSDWLHRPNVASSRA